MVQNVVEFLNSTDPNTFPKREKGLREAKSGVKDFFEIFVNEDGRLSETETSGLINIPLAESTILTDLDSTPELQVHLMLQGQQSFGKNTSLMPGVIDSSLETTGKFVIDSRAKYNNVERRVVSVFEQRTIQLSLPVLSRFVFSTLELKDKEKLNPNSMNAKGTSPQTFADPINSPLVISGGQAATNSKGLNSADFLNKQGWIFFLPEINLGVAPGNGKYGENFLLAGNCTFFREIKKDAGPFGKEFGPVRGKTFEMWNTHQLYSQLTGVYKETKEDKCLHILENAPPTDNVQYSSLFRLMGTSDQQSPTLVFGRVFRSYILEQGLQKISDSPPANCSYLPYVGKDKFNSVPWTSSIDLDSQRVLKETNNANWEDYRQAMSLPVTGAYYNEGLAFWFDSQGYTGVPNQRTVQPNFKTEVIPKLGRFLDYTPKRPENLFLDSATTLYRSGKRVFDGDLSQILTHIGNTCIARCGRQFETSQSLKEYLSKLKNDGINPTGFYHLKNSFDYTEDWNQLAIGGVGFVCDKSITISSCINPHSSALFSSESPVNQIYLISLDGDIVINTGSRIEAALVSVTGTFRSTGLGVDVFGLVAAKSIGLSGLCNSSHKMIQYDPRYDWTEPDVYKNSFRTILEEQPLTFFEKPK